MKKVLLALTLIVFSSPAYASELQFEKDCKPDFTIRCLLQTYDTTKDLVWKDSIKLRIGSQYGGMSWLNAFSTSMGNTKYFCPPNISITPEQAFDIFRTQAEKEVKQALDAHHVKKIGWFLLKGVIATFPCSKK